MNTQWPEIDEPGISPAERSKRRERTIQMLVERIRHIPDLTQTEREIIASALQTFRAAWTIWRVGKSAIPIAAMLIVIVQGWDAISNGVKLILSGMGILK